MEAANAAADEKLLKLCIIDLMKEVEILTSNLSITTFNIDWYTTLENFLEDYREIGLDTLELNGRVTRRVIEELFPHIEKGIIKISSLHNYCPKIEIAEEDGVQLSALDEETRKLAVQHTKVTIETARMVGAKAVVLHTGSVEGLKTLMNELKELYQAGKKDSMEYNDIRNRLIEQRKNDREKYASACEKSLIELSEFISRKNFDIKLGLENRLNHGEIPIVTEYDEWFDKYCDLPIFLWYDYGHGEVQHNLGLIDKNEIFHRHGKRLLGLHIHDCEGINDHILPGTGTIKFDFIKDHLRPDVLRVLEYGKKIKPIGKIPEGIEYLRKTGIL